MKPFKPASKTLETTQPIGVELASLNAGTLTDHEAQAIRSLIAYQAYRNGLSQETTQAMLTTAFGIERLEETKRGHFDEAIRFLMEFHFDTALN